MPDTIARRIDDLNGIEVSGTTNVDVMLNEDLDTSKELDYRVSENSELALTIFDLGNRNLDLTVRVHLKRGSSCGINIASICPGGKKKVFSVDTIHDERDTTSFTKMAGINAADGTLRFIGTSDVPNGSHNSTTRQEGRITNLSAGSKSEVSPALLIKDNEVNASHGAAVGAYDPNAMYYLMSRGLTESESRKLITLGSLVPIVESFSDEGLKEEAMATLQEAEI